MSGRGWGGRQAVRESWICLYAGSKSATLGEDVVMLQKAPGRADLGCGEKIDIFSP